MLKVLHVLGSLDRNGKETFVMNAFRNLDRECIMFDFLLFSPSQDGYYNEAKQLGSTIFTLPQRREGFFRYKMAIDNFFSLYAKDYSAVHLHVCSLTSIEPLIFAKKYNICVRVIHSHNSGWEGFHNFLFHLINKLRIDRYATHYLACSDLAAHWCFSFVSSGEKALVIKNGIDLNKFAYNTSTRTLLRSEMGLENQLVIGHIGRFTEIKNQNYVVDVFEEIHKHVSKSILLLIGIGELQNEVREKVRIKGLQDNVMFLGVREDVPDLLQIMDCFVFPSLYEGLPFSLIEAQTSGLPIFTSLHVSREVKVTDNLFFLELGNCKKWSDAITKQCSTYNRVDASSVVQKAGFSIEATVEVLISIYKN